MRKKTSQIYVVHIITSLAADGAGTMLYRILAHTNRSHYYPVVISLDDDNGGADKIRAHGIPVHCLNMANSLTSGWHILRLVRLLRELEPDVIQGWMYHGNLAASIANLALSNRHPVFWNIRQSLYDITLESTAMQWAIRLSAKRSGKPTGIIYNAYRAAEQHADFGFKEHNAHIIPNGFDTHVFAPNAYSRETIRHSLAIPEEAFVIGMVANYHPMKNHALFLEAANLLNKHQKNVHFILTGREVTHENREIQQLLKRFPALQANLHLTGERQDIPAILNALDVFTLTSSYGEGFSNVVGEAMACGIPCIATDVGDVPRIIGNTGHILRDASPSALAFAWLEWINAGATWRDEQGQRAMQRIKRHYSIHNIAHQYQELYASATQEIRTSETALAHVGMKKFSSNISMNRLA
ncbi:glycosyltransferase [Thiothrix sp.]|jgi:glycosyltransferase involved in cell wall biosynthesis|uniref:glycosyltransferase n=1 Tax=Thiothrix sp. TaxID=1032 RepID=UPI00257A9E62|nr:glycosyltransferase [Thiothrix sp.]